MQQASPAGARHHVLRLPAKMSLAQYGPLVHLADFGICAAEYNELGRLAREGTTNLIAVQAEMP